MNHAISLLLLLGLVAGCATMSDPSYLEGKRLVAAGQFEEGLALLDKAAQDNPRERDLRMEYLRSRETAVSRLIQQGDSSRVNGRMDEAAAAYARALKIDPDHPRARAAQESVATERRHSERVRDAAALLGAGNLAGAEARLREVLAENAGHTEARNLMRRVLDAQASRSLAPPELRSAIGKQVTLEFRDASLRSVFDVISRTTGINFVFDKDVRPDLRTTIVVRNSTVDDVIRLILVTNQLERKILNDNSLLVYPNTPAKNREYQEMVVRSFYIANADVKQVLNLVRSVVKTRDIYIDEKLNLLVMKDTPHAVRLAERLIATQDLADPEVVLEVEVLEVGTSRIQELGIRFPDRVQWQDPATVPQGSTTGAPLQRADANLIAFVATPPLILNLRQQDGLTNVLANPRIRVKNREKARVHIGDRVPVITTTSTANVGVSASVSYLDVGLKLEVEPQIHLEGDVAIKVGLEVSNIVKEVPVSGGGIAYQLGTRNATTALRLKDGETQILAGLIQDDERLTANKLPLVGDLPVVGRLFSSNLDNRTKTEIVLLITPRVVRNLTRPDHIVAEYFSGTDSAVGAAPLTISATNPGALAITGSPAARSALAPAPAAAPAAALAPASISLSGPQQAQIGGQFIARVAMAAQTGAASATMDVVFDPALLEFVPQPGSEPTAMAGPGRVRLRLAQPGGPGAGQPAAQITFRVVAKDAVQTALRVENADAQDQAGNPVPAPAPAPQPISIVRPPAPAEARPAPPLDTRPESVIDRKP
jgi:general secretion pathway protein D